ncbi:hypothetical protein Tco_0412542 [Tanacetum coccineum]
MAALVCGGRIRGAKKNGGSRGIGASSLAGTKSSGCSGSEMYTGTWSLVHLWENVVPAPASVCGSTPRNGFSDGY